MWSTAFKGLTFGVSTPKPPNGIMSGMCAHRGCVHSIISYLICVLPQRSSLTEPYFRNQCVFFVGVPRQWGPQWSIPQQALYGVLTVDHKKLASGLIKPNRASPHCHRHPKAQYKEWTAISEGSGSQTAWFQADDTFIGNGFLNLALGCKKADEVSDEAGLSML